MKARTTASPPSSTTIGVPVASGHLREHRLGEGPKVFVAVDLPGRPHQDARLAIRRQPLLAQVRGQIGQADRFGRQRLAQIVEQHRQEAHQARFQLRLRRRPLVACGGQLAQSPGERRGARVTLRGKLAAKPVRKRAAQPAQGRVALAGIQRWRLGRLQQRTDGPCQRIDQLELLVLRLRHEALDRHHLAHGPQRCQVARDPIGLLEARRQDVDHVRRGLGIGLQPMEGEHGLRLRVLQIERIEIEGELRQGEQRGKAGDRGQREDGPTVALDRQQQPGPGDGRRLLERHQAQQRRQQREAREPGHQHAERGDDAELGEAQINGRHEAQEADRGAQSAQRQRAGNILCGALERLDLARVAPDLLLVAQHYMDAEIDTQAHEQDGKGHRDQIEPADRERREARGDEQAHDKRQQRRDDQAPRAKAPEQQEHDGDGGEPRSR